MPIIYSLFSRLLDLLHFIYMKKITVPQQAFVLKIQALYDIEEQIVKALPKMIKAASDPGLKKGFSDHLKETLGHVDRLKQIFKELGEKPKALPCDGIRGIIKDAAWVMKVPAPSFIKDAMIAGSARYVEHYEMAGYISAILEANLLGLVEVAESLGDTLMEEEDADIKLGEAIEMSLQESEEI